MTSDPPCPPALAPEVGPNYALVSCMRNEGLFIVEWLAHHLTIGFDEITIFTNTCTDGSDLLLDRLQALGYCRHFRHEPAPGTSPQMNAMRLAFTDARLMSAGWLMHIDADEFLCITTGEGRIADLVAQVGAKADVIAVLWKLFGDNGIERWTGGDVLPRFTRAQAAPLRRVVNHKSLFRPQKFGICTDHMPKQPLVDSFTVVNTAGQEVSPEMVHHPRKSRYKMKFGQQTFANASLHHYAVKSLDIFLMKNDRGDGNAVERNGYFRNSTQHRRYNINDAEDRAILAYQARSQALMAQMRQDPQVRALETAATEAWLARRDRILTPEQIDAWTAHPRDTADEATDVETSDS